MLTGASDIMPVDRTNPRRSGALGREAFSLQDIVRLPFLKRIKNQA